MRTRGYVVQQVLGAEAAGVVTQAVSLARRRGHAQVTPLHIARAMLSAAGGLLRAACVQSQSHPLQYNALVLCFDVALDRFAMAGPAAGAVIRHSDLHVPAPSNAFVAALRRAQALHKRRGSVDGQGQWLAAKVVELEQLIVSILDDPSIDRVMREAGFSSSQVKANIVSEQPNRTSSDTTSPNPVYQKIRAGQGQPSLETVRELHPAVVDIPDCSLALSLSCNSESEAIQAKSRTGRPVLFDGTEVVTTTPILPSWLRRYQDTFPTRSTRWSTSLQVQTTCRQQKFTELTAENLKILCDALELRVPRHKDIVPGISSTVLRCRSGMTRRVRKPTSSTTWLLFRGRDDSGKKAMAQELAKLVFGSYTEFIALQVNSNPTPSGKITLKRQRSRDNDNGYVGMRFFEAILENPHRVILINGIDQLDHDSAIRAENAVASGTMKGCNGDVVSLEDAIVVLSSEVSESSSLVSSPRVKQRISKLNHEEGDTTEKEVKSPRFSLDLNACTKDGEDDEDNLVGHVGIMNIVDGVFFFD